MNYKEKARAYFTAVNNYDQATVTAMVEENYIQHNPSVPTGRAAFVGFLPKLGEFGSKIENIRMLNDGKHIIMHHKWTNARPFGADTMAAFHIIRFDENDLIAEHWNVITELTSANSQGRTLIDGEREIKDHEKTDQNKTIVAKLYSGLIAGEKTFSDYFHEDFHQHHPETPDGITGLLHLLKNIKYVTQHKIFGEGNFVLSISEGELSGKLTAFYDLYRLDYGKIAEHWSVYQDIPTENLANDNTMFNF